MSKGKKIGGIVLVIFGTIFLVIGIAVGALFGAMNGVMDEAIEEVQKEIDEARETGVSTYGQITDIDSENMATIEFYCEEDGEWYEMNMMVMSDEYQVGSGVEVCYEYDKLNDPDYVPVVPVLYMDAMGMVGDTVPGVGIGVGVFFGVLGAILLIIGIVMLVSNKKDKKWVDEINTRNAAQGINGAPMGGYQPMPGGQPMGGYSQPMGGYSQPQNAQPLSGYSQQQGSQPLNGYSQPQSAEQAQTDVNTSNPYQQ